MGGPGGADPKTYLHSGQAFAGNLFLKEDFYNASSCVNCHQVIPQSTCQTCHKAKVFFPSSVLLRPSPCDAETRWPSFLQEAVPQIQLYPWWVDQNYLSTQLQRSSNPVSPRKVDLSMEIFLTPGAGFQVPGYEFQVRPDAKIIFAPQLAGKGEDLSILLENQKLLELHNVRVTPSLWYGNFLPNNWLQEINVKEGHPFLRAVVGALNLFRNIDNPSYSDIDLQEYIFPHLPVAYNTQTGELLNMEEYKSTVSSQGSVLEKMETTYEIVKSNEFPPLIKLSEILNLIQKFIQASELSKKNEKENEEASPLDRFISAIALNLEINPDEIKYPNFYARFNPHESNPLSLKVTTLGPSKIESVEANGKLTLEELFIPQWVHLQNGEAHIEVSYHANQEATLHIDSLHAYLKPMDYFKEDARQLGRVQLQSGEIQDGKAIRYFGIDFPPGIHLHQVSSNIVDLQANLELSFRLKLPFLGDIQMSFPLIIQTQLKKNSEGIFDLASFRPLPRSSLVYLPSLKVEWGNPKNPHSLESDLLLTDIPELMMPTELGTLQSGFWMSTQIQQSKGLEIQEGLVEFSLPLLIDAEGNYSLENLISSFQTNSQIHFALKNHQALEGEFKFSRQAYGGVEEMNFFASLAEQDSSGHSSVPLLEDFNLRYVNQAEGPDQHTSLSLDARAIFLAFLNLTDSHLDLKYRTLTREDEVKYWGVDYFSFSANQKASPWKARGILRGPFVLRSTSKAAKPFEIEWNPSQHQMKLSNIGIAFNAKKITVPGLAQFTQNGISSLDLDGRLGGHWLFNTDSYAGKGKVVIQGDKEGDIHFRGKNGRRLEAPLNPEEPQRLYEIPLLANTTFVIDQIKRLDLQNEQVKGHFKLSTLVDWLALRPLGIQWNEHDEFVFEFDHLPYSPAGYDNKVREFFRNIALQKVLIKAKGGTP